MVDFHAHILAGVDHGCDSLEMAEKQLKMAKEVGISTIISTSHFYPHRQRIDDFLRIRDGIFEKTYEIAKNIGIKLVKGAEVLLVQGIENLPNLEKLCIGNSEYMLLEMPFGEWTEGYFESIYEISHIRGIKPIFAHIDRYVKNDVNRIFEQNYICQMNAEAFCGMFKPLAFKKWLNEGRISAIGSDIHTLGNNYKEFSFAYKKAKGISAFTSNEDKLIKEIGI